MVAYRKLNDVEVTKKKILVRLDLNVPMQDGIVSDSHRVEKIVPTIRNVLKRGGYPILISHFGRPKGKYNSAMSLAPLAPIISAAIDKIPVKFIDDCIGPTTESEINTMNSGEILLLENLRFHPGEEKNDSKFIESLSRLGDIFVNDAFSASHRSHASTTGLAYLMPSAAGLQMEAELTALEAAFEKPKRPLTAVVGGAKVSTKLDVLSNLIKKVDSIIIGGGMANTFLHAKGFNIGLSLCEKDLAETAKIILDESIKEKCEIVLPIDGAVAHQFMAGAPNYIAEINSIADEAMILDLGPKSLQEIKRKFEQSSTILWNGPLGAFEIEPFDRSTNTAAQFAAALTKENKLTSIAGGGDTVAALRKAGAYGDFSYVSTAGGAFLEWMEGKPLPGVEALQKDL
ncbi:phosphoglycerate kinase [Candidatus Poribacteria bacterium]|nr:phosphoglycerate kinase [Candidatus Poribacteria bacterium]|tara:strand:- start:7308 stop:8510 length:1203 start_codon:yes stop_codon:yes gene_type:complete